MESPCYLEWVMTQPSADALIRDIRGVLEADDRVRHAWLFGSRARDQADVESDVDVAVDAHGADLLALSGRISERVGLEVDVVALSGASIPLLEELIRDGRLIYESSAGAGAAWRSRALAQLETDRPWYRRMRDAWLERVAQEGLGSGQ